MDKVKLIRPEKINLKNHPVLNETWLQEVIAKNPEILGLGDLVLKDKERKQPRAADLPNRRGISAAHSFSIVLMIGTFRRAPGRRLTRSVRRCLNVL